MSEPDEATLSRVYYKDSGEVALDRLTFDEDNYEETIGQALVEAFTVFDGWCEPLAVAVVTTPSDRDAGELGDESTLVLAERLPDDIHIDDDWAQGSNVVRAPTITGDLVRDTFKADLARKQDHYGQEFELFGVPFGASRYAIGPDTMPERFILTDWARDEAREIPTTVHDGKRWIAEPRIKTLFHPVDIDFFGGKRYDFTMSVTLRPDWAHFGDEDSWGWPLLVEAADRLVEKFSDWEIRESRPGGRYTS